MDEVEKQAHSPYLPSWEYVTDGEPDVLTTGFTCMVPTINSTGMSSA